VHSLLPILFVYCIVAVVVTVGLLLVAVSRRDQGHKAFAAETRTYETELSPPKPADTTKHEAKPALLKRADTTEYEAEASLLTPAERSFFGVLRQALMGEYYICPKVRLADIIRPASQSSRSGWQTAFNRISAKHVDFAICSPNDLSVVGVIELDDRTHRRFERGFRDSTVDAALSGAGIPVIRVQASEYYSQPAVRDLVLNSLKRPAEPPANISSQRLSAGGKGARRQLTPNLAN
jgi:hypothetical protein